MQSGATQFPPNKNLPWICVDGGHFKCAVVVDYEEIIVDAGSMLFAYINKHLDRLIEYGEVREWNFTLLSQDEKINLTVMSMFEWEANLLARGLIYKLVNNHLQLSPR